MTTRIVSFLENLPHDLFVLHGSPILTEVLEPRQAHCSNGEEFKNLHGVYASLAVCFALIKALSHATEESPGWKIDYNQEIIRVYGKGLSLGPGFIYVLPRKEFNLLPNGIWCISSVSIIPLAIVEITPDIRSFYPYIHFDF